MDISAWLRELGLERYEQTFRENNIDGEIIPNEFRAVLGKVGDGVPDEAAAAA